jgi:hypothetical protein
LRLEQSAIAEIATFGVSRFVATITTSPDTVLPLLEADRSRPERGFSWLIAECLCGRADTIQLLSFTAGHGCLSEK